jgi:predicted Zn-ribbon and HTH transcriptional regulator
MAIEIKVPELICKRCGWKWVPRTKVVKVCPHCKSPYWNTPKSRGEEEGEGSSKKAPE